MQGNLNTLLSNEILYARLPKEILFVQLPKEIFVLAIKYFSLFHNDSMLQYPILFY